MRCLLFGLGLAWGISLAVADSGADNNALKAKATNYLREIVAASHPDSQANIEVDGIDPRLRLPACPTPGFRLPPGNRPWGTGTLEVRCETPAVWTLFLTYRIRLRGPALLARHPLALRHTLAAGDLVLGEAEYSGDPGRYPRDPNPLQGATLTKSISAGNPIDIDMLRRQPLIKAGQNVKILIDAPGFQVSQHGIAQQAGAAGEMIKLKTTSGKLIQGVVQPNGTVQVRP